MTKMFLDIKNLGDWPLLETAFLFIYLFIFAFISWSRPKWGIYWVVFTLPSYLWRLKIFGIPTTVLELKIYISALSWLIKQFSIFQFSIFQHQFKNYLFLLPVSLIFIGATLSSIFSVDQRISFGILKGWFFDPLLFSFIFLKTIKKEQIKNVFSALGLSGVIVAAISLFYYFSGNLTFDNRLRAFYLSPNHLAMYLAPCFLLTIFLSLDSTPKKFLKYLWIIGTFLMALALYFTYSYGAWLGVVVTLFFLIFFSIQKKKKKIFYFLLLLFFIILLLFFQLESPKFKNLIESPRSSFYSRIMVWESAWKILQDNIILGIGPGMFQKYYLDYQQYFPPYLEWAVPQPHNLFLAFWLQTGLIGFGGFIWLLIWFFKVSFRPKLETKNLKLEICFMAIMVYTLVHGLVDTTYWKNDLSVIFWLTISLLIVSNENQKI